MGGLPRRATIVDSLKLEEGADPLFVVDAGNFSMKNSRISEEARPQQQRKAEAILDAFARDPIDALGIGAKDLHLGVDWLQEAVASRSLPATLANLSCGGEEPFEGHQVVSRDGVRVGFVGVLSDTSIEGCEVSDSVAALRDEIEAMGPVNMLVVFGHGSNQDDEALAEAVPEIDVIVNGHARVTRTTPELLPNGAVQLGAGSRGKKQGVASIVMVEGGNGFSKTDALVDLKDRRETYIRRLESARRNLDAGEEAALARAERQITFFSEKVAALDEEIAASASSEDGRSHSIRVELVPLDRNVDDQPDVLAMLETAKAEIEAMEAGAVIAPLTDSEYIGSVACSGCHAEIFAQWQETGHARAYATLQVENRELDRDCFSCHVTGAFDERGPQHPTQVTQPLQNVGCESCHGPGRKHIAAPGQGTIVRSPGADNCVQCHDGKQDEGRFDLATYLPRVQHQSP
jgi:hypothetical protein